MTIDEAIDIAWGIGQFMSEPPTAHEALEIINEQLRICDFNWLIGQAAREALTPTNGLGQDKTMKGIP